MKRFIIICITIATLALSLKSFKTYAYEKAYDELNPQFTEQYSNVEDRVIEYGSRVDESKVLVNDKYDFDIRRTTLNDEVLTFVLSTKDLLNQVVEKEVDILFKVIDTEFPKIELENDKLILYRDSEYDIADNVTKVYDSVQGNIDWAYETDLDMSKEGEYLVKIIAVDNHNNRSEKDFTIKVIQKPVKNTNIQLSQNISSNDWWAMGSVGAVKCGGYQAPLEYINMHDYGQRQSVINSGAAGYTFTGAGAEYIGDHDGQGFAATLSNNVLQIKRPDGSIDTFYKVSTHTAASDSWVAYDGVDCWNSGEGRLMTQVCSGGNLIFVFWN